MSAQTCPSCLSPAFEGGRCSHCGFNGAEYTAPRTALPLGAVVGKYRIGVMKTSSRQSQIYTGVHTETSTPVIVEEFFPNRAVGRNPGKAEVLPATDDADALQRIQQACLLIEASAQKRPLERVETLRANNTVYSIFKPASGATLSVQCEALADNPVLFRDSNGMPQMTINTLEIPPMPEERPYNPEQGRKVETVSPETVEAGGFDQTPVSEMVMRENRKKLTGWIIAAAAVLVIGLCAAFLTSGPGQDLLRSMGILSTPTPAATDVPTEEPPAELTEVPTEEPTPEPTKPVEDSSRIPAEEFISGIRARLLGNEELTVKMVKTTGEYSPTMTDSKKTTIVEPGKDFTVTGLPRKSEEWLGEYQSSDRKFLCTVIVLNKNLYLAHLGQKASGDAAYTESDFTLLFRYWDRGELLEKYQPLTLSMEDWQKLFDNLKKYPEAELMLKVDGEAIWLSVILSATEGGGSETLSSYEVQRLEESDAAEDEGNQNMIWMPEMDTLPPEEEEPTPTRAKLPINTPTPTPVELKTTKPPETKTTKPPTTKTTKPPETKTTKPPTTKTTKPPTTKTTKPPTTKTSKPPAERTTPAPKTTTPAPKTTTPEPKKTPIPPTDPPPGD